MTPSELVKGLLLGCGLLAIGVVPGIVQAFLEAIVRFQDALRGVSSQAARRVPVPERGRVPGQEWFAVAGVVVMTLSLFAYLTQ